MTMQLNEENGGKVLVLHVSGKPVKEDCEHFVPEFERLVRLPRLGSERGLGGFQVWYRTLRRHRAARDGRRKTVAARYGSGWTKPLYKGREHHYNDFKTQNICCIAKSWDSQLEMVREYNACQ